MDLQAFLGQKSTRVFITICMIICYENRRGVVPHCFVIVSGVTYCRAISAPLLRNGIEELGHAGCEGFAGELADGVSPVSYTHLTLPTNREV